jgi:hypothetical protein
VRLPPLAEAAGKTTPSVVAAVIQDRRPNGGVSWSGEIEPLELPTGDTYKLIFTGQGATDDTIALKFVQTPVHQSKGSANAFDVTIRRTADGSYRGDLRHPELGGAKVGEIMFIPRVR